jgi:ubiquinone/menaquinone biosynthesis C-methylase UbiE
MTHTPPSPAHDLPAQIPGHFRNGSKRNWHQRRRYRAVLSLLKGNPGRVLDYGCGYGDLTHAIATTHGVIGCDVDPTRVAFARREYPTIEFHQCGPGGTPFGDQSFDIIVSSVVIHFVPNPRAYLQEVRRLLRPNGILLILFRNEAVVRNALRKLVGRGKAPTRLWIASMSDARALVSEAGFEIIRSTYFYDPPFVSWRNVGDWFVGTIEQIGSMIHYNGLAGYHGFLTRRINRG